MKVRQLIEFLQASDPEALVVADLPFEGLVQITAVERRAKNEGDLVFLFSWETVPVVELSSGDAEFMRSQGRDVVGVEKIFTMEQYKAT